MEEDGPSVESADGSDAKGVMVKYAMLSAAKTNVNSGIDYWKPEVADELEESQFIKDSKKLGLSEKEAKVCFAELSSDSSRAWEKAIDTIYNMLVAGNTHS